MPCSMSFEEQFFTLLDFVEQMVHRSGQGGDFDSSQWLVDWLDKPLPALGWRKPVQVLLEPGGFEAVRAILARMESGAYC